MDWLMFFIGYGIGTTVTILIPVIITILKNVFKAEEVDESLDI